MTTKTSNFRKIKTEFVLQPVDGIARAASEDLDKIVSCKIASLETKGKDKIRMRIRGTYGFLGVVEESL